MSTIPTEKPGAALNSPADRRAIVRNSSAQLVCCSGSRIAKPGQPNLAAQVSFGANNTAILSFGRVSEFLPASWANAPLRIQLTNVTGSCSLAP